MNQRIAVLGAGAIGSSVAADLTKAGLNVSVIDQWPAHVEAMKASGLLVTTPDEEFRTAVNAFHICEVCNFHDPFDVVLLAAKSFDSRWMAHLIEPHLRSDGVLVGVQNGMNEETLASAVGARRVVGCAFELSAEVFTPGVVQRNTIRGRTWFGLGEHHGRITPRLRALQAIMTHVGRVDLTTNIWGSKWSKLINSSMILGPFGMLGMQSWQATDIPEVFRLCIRIGRETMAVGSALGYTIEPIFGLSAEEFAGSTDEVVERLLRTIVLHHGKDARQVRGVVLQDFAKGRHTEAANINGYIGAKGREASVPTPANDAVMQVIRRIEHGELKPGRSNLALVEQLMGQA
ncbi:MAG: ketopantoate reductase family protein [Burkholderiales bacterium]